MRIVDPAHICSILVVVVEHDHDRFLVPVFLDDLHDLVGAGRILYKIQDHIAPVQRELFVAAFRLRRIRKHLFHMSCIDIVQVSDRKNSRAIVHRIHSVIRIFEFFAMQRKRMILQIDVF